MALFSKVQLDADFEAALDTASYGPHRKAIGRAQQLIRSYLNDGEALRFVMYEDYTGSWIAVVTDRRLLFFPVSVGGTCKDLKFACGPREVRAIEVGTNPQTGSSRVSVRADGFQVTLKIRYPQTGHALVRAAEEMAPAAPPPPAPVLPADFFVGMLQAARFPVTDHNLFAVTERVGSMFLTKAREYIGGLGTPRQLAQFDLEYSHPGESVEGWPQRILYGLVDWDPEVSPHIQGLPDKVRGMLLESAGREGRFFGPDPTQPLPTLADF